MVIPILLTTLIDVVKVRTETHGSRTWKASHDDLMSSRICTYGDFRKWGIPQSWLVYRGESQSKMDDMLG